jgi:murein DD-endopeptidase MepM/ murein hydrolase activator NlpD
VTEARRSGDAAGRVRGSTDVGWAIVSTGVTASVAAMVTFLAMAAEPSSSRLYEPKPEQGTQSFELLSRLLGGPAGQAFYRQAGLVAAPNASGPVDRLVGAGQDAKSNTETKTLKVGNGDTIIAVLQGAGVSAEDAAAVVDAMKPLYSPRSIRSGQIFEATFGPATNAQATPADTVDTAQPDDADSSERRLLSLSFSPSIERQITVSLTVPDGYMARDVPRRLEGRFEHAGATIDSSLYLAAIQAGLPANLTVELIRIFSYDVDFQRDVQPGDQFDVVFNRLYTQQGQPAKPGDIVSASMTLSGKKHTLYRFESGGEEEYFDADGHSAKSLLMKTPVDGARISSTFGRRFHPVLGYTRMHKGIDFAVPTGTPVMAAGSGSVSYAGYAGEYGNFVVITHSNGYATAYGHLSRFAVKTGTRVHQGQVVAYSGATGLVTGPHLHYEIRVNNSQVNPAAVKVAAGRALDGEERQAFLAERARIDTLVASLPVQHKLAQATGLRESSDQ